MRKIFFAFAFIAFFVTTNSVQAGEYKIGVKHEKTDIVSDISLCKDRSGLCQISIALENGDTIEIEARFEEWGIINFMFQYDGDYLRIGKARKENLDLVVDSDDETERKISLYHGPSETAEEFMGIKIPEPAAGNEIAFAKFTLVVRPIKSAP